jgi:hypothetical protein
VQLHWSKLSILFCSIISSSYYLFSGRQIEGLLIQVLNLLFCFVLQIDLHHWHYAVQNIVVLSSGSAAVSASATTANSCPSSCSGGSSNYQQQTAFLLAAAATAAIISSFMKKSICACICVSACTLAGSQPSAFQAHWAPKLQE